MLTTDRKTGGSNPILVCPFNPKFLPMGLSMATTPYWCVNVWQMGKEEGIVKHFGASWRCWKAQFTIYLLQRHFASFTSCDLCVTGSRHLASSVQLTLTLADDPRANPPNTHVPAIRGRPWHVAIKWPDYSKKYGGRWGKEGRGGRTVRCLPVSLGRSGTLLSSHSHL